MPSITDTKKFSERVFSSYGAGGEPLGEPPAPRLGGESRSGLSEQLVEGALEQGRLRTAIREMPEQERRRLAEAVLDELAEERELPEEVNERMLDAMLRALLAGKRSEREILGRDGLLGELTGRLVERALSEELSEHLGYPAG